ncbi:MAG: hypothetical protein ACRD4W_12655, partial [Nitrososphaeraceae archaeon]
MLNFINVHIINARRSLACTIGGIRKTREVLDFCSAEVRHPDHTLITYPDLGHLFYPSSQWLTAAG